MEPFVYLYQSILFKIVFFVKRAIREEQFLLLVGLILAQP